MYTYYIHYMDKKEEHARIFIAHNIADKDGLLGLLLKYREEIEGPLLKRIQVLEDGAEDSGDLIRWLNHRREQAAILISNLIQSTRSLRQATSDLIDLTDLTPKKQDHIRDLFNNGSIEMERDIKIYFDNDSYPLQPEGESVSRAHPGEGQ